MKRLRILVAAPSPELRSRMRTVFGGAGDMEVVGEASSPVELLLETGRTGAELAVMELETRDALPGSASHLLAEYPHTRVLALSSDESHALLFELRLERIRLPAGPALLDALRRTLRDGRAAG